MDSKYFQCSLWVKPSGQTKNGMILVLHYKHLKGEENNPWWDSILQCTQSSIIVPLHKQIMYTSTALSIYNFAPAEALLWESSQSS
mgnify:CR=1 FL=1